ncbi:type I restriction enzyme, S subunit [Ectothiorhodospira magna]|uniref:Type I restriction enzyme, S subunit n=1 Tax=Ectothiorhodospira magna TaxID=867345 RepID=A0A1H9F0M3_9GAMM|nr:restriction endonuclease subunit S [Ectothiorhodospira magna]SEQ30768.1 type I restriction enzyme, S subunit [Ectothiorhodospira magna]
MREGWSSTALKNVCTVDKAKHSGTTLPYVGLEHIESGTGKFIGSLAPATAKSTTFSFTAGHVLYGRLRPYLNKVLLPEFDGHCSSEIFPLRVESSLDRRFLYYWLTWEPVVKEIDSTSTGARMPRANINKLLEFEIPLPSFSEQKRIVAILDEAFAGIATAVANTEKNLANARELFESYLNSVFSQRGESWARKPLETLVHDTCTLSYGIVQPGPDVTDGLPVVRPTDLREKFIRRDTLKTIDPSLAKAYSRTTLHGGDLLLCVRGTTGVVSIAATELEGANVTRGIVPIRFNPDLLGQELGYYLLRSPVVQEQISAKTYGAALMQINIRDVRKLLIPVPSRKIHEELRGSLDDLSVEAGRLQSIYRQKLNALSELKQSLLQKAFSGELTADKEVSNAIHNKEEVA